MTGLKKFLPFVAAILFVALITLVWWFRLHSRGVVATLMMESDAMAITDYYIPKRIRLQPNPAEPNLKLPRFRFPSPKFGTLVLGQGPDSLITLALDEAPDRSESILYIDRNNDENLTDDGPPGWDEQRPDYWLQEALVNVQYRGEEHVFIVPYAVTFYRYKYRLHDSIVVFRNGYRSGTIVLQDSTYKLGLLDDNLNGRFDDMESDALIIDLNRDGKLNGHTDSPELFPLSSPFSIDGVAYRTKRISPAGDQIVLARVDTLLRPRVEPQVGFRAPLFRIRDMDGHIIDLSQFQNRVVLLDFWATWCKPWEMELERLKRHYRKYKDQGFEIIGLNLDFDLDLLRSFLQTRKITWPQVATGEGWRMPLVELYHVKSLPKNFLLDRSGVIRYKDLYGRDLDARVAELLDEADDQ